MQCDLFYGACSLLSSSFSWHETLQISSPDRLRLCSVPCTWSKKKNKQVNAVGKLTAEAFSQKNELPVLMRLERGPSTGVESVKSRQRRDEETRTQRTVKKMSRETKSLATADLEKQENI
ncbi:beta-1,3-galactosyltransferase 1 isoform X2 [Pseudorca crassidens]|uniref:beta-1,3-galactosyltransferase 1 isoform X2 n=1 Tax=Pseudorca crassidens TaxID=82174 RepID=UPI00352BD295